MIVPKKNRSRIHFIAEIVAVVILFAMAFATGIAAMQYNLRLRFHRQHGLP